MITRTLLNNYYGRMSNYQYVYIARHGLTVGNVRQTVQGFDDPLTEAGHEQAKRLARRAAKLTFTHLVASDMLRAQQTASYISDVTGKEVISEPLVREVVRPPSLVGTAHADPAYQDFLAAERENRDDANRRMETGENFSDVKTRALHVLTRFESFAEAPVFVVSHGHFIRCLLATILTERELTPRIYEHVNRTFKTYNTGISIVRRVLDTNHWEIMSFNDHAHFADD
jgi:broad specificity phosphatase PhoE